MELFCQVVQDILQNNYFKTNLENSEIRYFASTCWKFIREKSSSENHFFFEL